MAQSLKNELIHIVYIYIYTDINMYICYNTIHTGITKLNLEKRFAFKYNQI